MSRPFIRQIVASRDFGPPCPFKISLDLHDSSTILPQARPSGRMDYIVDTGVERLKTAQHLSIGRVDDGVHPQDGDIALPEGAQLCTPIG